MALQLQFPGYMKDKTLLGIALLAVSLGGCALDGEEDGPGGVDQTPPPLDEVNEVVCRTELSITGSMVPVANPEPGSPTSCWGVGVWTFRATANATNTEGGTRCAATTLLPEYKVEVKRDPTVIDAPETYSFLTNPSQYVRLKVSSGGGGLCEGIFEIYSADGTIIHNLHPALQAAGADGTHPLNGKGDYTQYKLDQRLPVL